MGDGSQNSIESLVTSSVKIALKAFSFALAFPVRLLNASQTSRSTGAAERGTPAEWADWPEARREAAVEVPQPQEFLVPDEELDESILGVAGNGAISEDEPAPYVPAPEEDALVPDEEEIVPSAADPAMPSSAASSFEDVMEIRFARLKDNAIIPERAHEGDAGMDLCAAESARIGPGQRVGVGTGLAVEIPEGWAGMVLPRSGLALKNGIALVNAPGLIDPGYRGEIRVLLLNTDATSEFKVSVGDRIAQLVLTPFSTAQPVEVGGLEASARGSGGFGSSGS
jgi:dUTP pyrophosphatase